MKTFLRVDNDFLTEAKPYPSKACAIDAFREIANELARYGQECTASLHIAESKEELAEYPDFVLSLGPRGGLRVVAA